MEPATLEENLQSVNDALAEDSTDVDAHLEKARLLRLKADSTVPLGRYIALHRQAWTSEQTAVSLDEDERETVQRRRLQVYDREMRRGEGAYNRASKEDDDALFRQAIGYFGAAGTTVRDSATPALNEAYARLRIGETKAVVPVLEEYVQRADTVARSAYKILGQLYVSSGRYEQATDLLDRATTQYPTDKNLAALRLNAYNRAGDADEALAAYREQIEKSPNQARYRYNYGALLLKAQRYDAAINQLQTAVDLAPDNAEGQYNLGAAYLNAALMRDDSIATITDDPAALRDTTLSPERAVDRLTERRATLFEKAIPPLERARALVEQDQMLRREGAQSVRQDACRALMVAYVQTQRPGKAAQVEDCTGFAESRRQ
jgi:tetratricopeptide (TPR) repeat protein